MYDLSEYYIKHKYATGWLFVKINDPSNRIFIPLEELASYGYEHIRRPYSTTMVNSSPSPIVIKQNQYRKYSSTLSRSAPS